jgi:integration host factor subunit alpha
MVLRFLLGAFLGGGVMTKAEIVQAVYDRLGGFSKKESAELVDLVFELMKETLGRGEKIKVSGFGNFVLRDKRKRQGRNPQTGDPIEITERRVLNFKASQILKQALNQDRPPALPVAASVEGGGSSAGGASHGTGNGSMGASPASAVVVTGGGGGHGPTQMAASGAAGGGERMT